MAVYYNSLAVGGRSFAANPLDVCIEIAQNDQKLFNAVLESDFMEIYAENGTIYLTEEEKEKAKEEVKENIFTKAKNAILKFIESVKKFFADLWRKITDLFDADKQLIKKYAAYLKPENYAGFKVSFKLKEGKSIEDMLQPVADLKAKVAQMISSGTITEISEDELNKIVDINEYIDKLDEPAVNDVITRDIVEFYTSGSYQLFRKPIDAVNQFEISSLNEILSKMKSGSSSDNNDEYKKASATIKLLSGFNARYAKLTVQSIKMYRAEFAKIGAYAMNKAGESKKSENKEETKTEAALTDIYLDLVNEMAIEEIFSLA